MDAGTIAALVTSVVTLVGLLIVVFGGVLSLERRLSRLETQIEPFWNTLQNLVPTILQRIQPPGNPVTSERWQYLLERLRTRSISQPEASELEKALHELEEDAKEKDDLAVLLALGLGLALLAALSGRRNGDYPLGARPYTPSVENVGSLLKRSIIGSCHQVSAKHLERYVEELEWWFNNRGTRRCSRTR